MVCASSINLLRGRSKHLDNQKWVKIQEIWIAERRIYADWWRYPKCLHRVQIPESEYHCSECKVDYEKGRERRIETRRQCYRVDEKSGLLTGHTTNCSVCDEPGWIWNSTSNSRDACLRCQLSYEYPCDEDRAAHMGGTCQKDEATYHGDPDDVQRAMSEASTTYYNARSDPRTFFNQDWATGVTQCSPGSKSESNSSFRTSSNHSTTSSNSKHPHERKDDPPSNEDEDSRSSKRPTILASSSKDLNDNLKFACPYRKHDPRKYNVRD
jgi:hypothetical protein